MQEVEWSGYDERLCPIKFKLPGGSLIVMPRCEPLTDDEYIAEVYAGWDAMCDRATGEVLSWSLPVEMKTCSFGRLNGKIVAVDYGGCGRDAKTTRECPATLQL